VTTKLKALSLFGIIAALLLLPSASSPHQTNSPPPLVSLVELIANPDKYDGKQVLITGFLRLEFEGDALYLHREDSEHVLTKNAIWVIATADMNKNRDRLDGTYVILEGTFNAKRHGHMGLYSGEIGNIKRAEPWIDRSSHKKAAAGKHP
jgi:hypothetical protein